MPPPTTRISFRTWCEDDLPLALSLWGNAEVARFIYASQPSREEIEARLRREIATQREHRVQYWPIFSCEGGAHLGCAGLRPHDDVDVFELGVHLLPAHWGRGLANEAAKGVIAHAFDTLHARSLFAGHGPANEASRRMLTRLGFRHTHDELYAPTGLMHPSYRLTSSEYAAPPA